MRFYSKLAGRQDPLEHEHHISTWTPQQMRDLLVARGMTVIEDQDLHTVAETLAIPVRHNRFYGLGRAVIADKPEY